VFLEFHLGSEAKNDSALHASSHVRVVRTLQRIVDPFDIIDEHIRVTRPFLTERQRRGILHVCATDLDDIYPLLSLRIDRVAQWRQCGKERCLTLTDAAMCMADGKESLDDCDKLTWPLG
jgi:hypothetical protein